MLGGLFVRGAAASGSAPTVTPNATPDSSTPPAEAISLGRQFTANPSMRLTTIRLL